VQHWWLLKLPVGVLDAEHQVDRCLPSTLLGSCPDQQLLLRLELIQVLLQVPL
jgi:hypothetical protein